MVPLKLPGTPTDYIFLTTDRYRYAVISYSPENTPYPCRTHASGSLKGVGRENAVGPLVAVDPLYKCLALHLYDGLLTCIPIHSDYQPPSKASGYSLLGEPYHVRLEERSILALTFLSGQQQQHPQLCLLHQDSRSAQHIITYALDVRKKQLSVAWKKSRVDGGSSLLLPSPQGGVVVVGQRQITYLATGISKVVPLPSCLIVSATTLNGRFLLGDEFGNLHILTTPTMELETLGSCTISSSLAHVKDGLVYVASQFGDSQLVQIRQDGETFLDIVEEYTNLGPIVDFDLVPTHAQQSQVVTCSGSSTSGSLRLIRNGIGMIESASVEMEGIQNMWSVRKSYHDKQDAYLLQSFVGETRVLGVSAATDDAMEEDDDEEASGTLEEVVLAGLVSTSSSLYVGNVQVGDTIVQITETEVRLIAANSMECTAKWSPADLSETADAQVITVASANEAGQIVVALRGGVLLYLRVKDASTIEMVYKTKLEREVSCVDLHPFVAHDSASAMEVEGSPTSSMVAVGLWDDFTVRLLSLDSSLGASASDQPE